MKISTKTIILIALCGVCMGLPLQPEPDNEPETTLLGKRQGAGDLQTAGTFGINVYSNPLAGGLYGASAGLLNPYSGYGMGGGLGGLGGIGSYGSSYGGGLGGAVATYGGAGLGGLGGGYGGYGSGIGGLGTYGAGIGGLGGYGGGLSTYGTGIGGLGGYGGGVGGLGGFGGGLGGLGGGLGGLGGGLGGLGGGLGGLGGGLGGLGGGAYSGATRKSHIKGKLIRLLQKLGSGGQIEFPTSGVGIGVGSLGGLGVAGAGGGGLDSLQAGEMIRNQLPYGMYGSVLTGNQYGFGFGNNFGVAGAGLVGIKTKANGLNQPGSPLLEVAKRRIFDSVGGYVASRIPNILDRLFVLREMEDDDDYDD